MKTESPPSGAHVAIVGAGPAGVAAARALDRAGACIDVFDEQPRAGGNVGRIRLRAPATRLERRAADGSRLRLLAGARVLAVHADRAVEFSLEDRYACERYDAVLLCCGAYDMYLPRPGLPAPGVTSAGALQALWKGQGVIPEGDVVIAGGGPFLYTAAAGLARAGARVTWIIDRLRASDYRWLGVYAAAIPGNGLEYMRMLATLRRRGVRIRRGAAVTAVADNHALLADGTRLGFDHLALTDIFIPQTQLARTAGCRQVYSSRGGYYITETDAAGRSSVDGIYVCGEGRGIRGWRHARLSGKAAAAACLNDLAGGPATEPFRWSPRTAILRRFGEALERRARRREPRAFEPDAIVCACEGVTAATVAEAVELGLDDLSSLKAVTRCGMGPCQGRYCEPLLCRALESAGRTPRAPLNQRGLTRPVAAAEFADGA